MGKIYQQMILRNSPEYRDFVMAAMADVANTIKGEATTVPAHNARVAIADRIIRQSDPKVTEFLERMMFRGMMENTVRQSLFDVQGNLNLKAANEAAILTGIANLWNETALAVWPTILEEYP